MAQTRSDRLSLKFLVSNGQAGTLIGTGGAAIRELVEVSGARVTVSNITDVYPGTSERIVLISGNWTCVNSAQSLLWEMLGSNSQSNGDKTIVWSPRAAQEAQGEFADVPVTGKITIAAGAGGLVLGRGGATFKSIAEESGAKLQMSSKDESMFTQERIITVSGTVDACSHAVSQIVSKLAEDLELAQYVNRGASYTSHLGALGGAGAGLLYTQGADQRGRGRQPRGAGVGGVTASIPGVTDVSATTEITINVPDTLVGNILGRQGSTMREIMSLSGAKVVVSPRGTFAEGSNNRVVTISGAPACAATAHILVNQKLQQQPTSRPARRPAAASEIA